MATKEKPAFLSLREKQTKMVKDSIEAAFDELRAGIARKNARNIFAQINHKKKKNMTKIENPQVS